MAEHVCILCEREFKRPSGLAAHMRKHQREAERLSKPIGPAPPLTTPPETPEPGLVAENKRDGGWCTIRQYRR